MAILDTFGSSTKDKLAQCMNYTKELGITKQITWYGWIEKSNEVAYKAVARNNGLAHASGKHVMFIDNDDYIFYLGCCST